MKTLKNLIALSQSVKIYVPSTINVNIPLESNAKYIEETNTILASFFGGATSTEGLGAWINAQGALIKERVTICQSFCKEAVLNEKIEEIYDFCLYLKKSLAQEAIALEINGILHFV